MGGTAARGVRALCVSGVSLTTALMACMAAPAFAQTPSFTQDQAEAGAALYAGQCAACHGADGAGASIGPALRGAVFLDIWGAAPLDELYSYMHASMPPAAPGALGEAAYADLLAHLMALNGVAPGDTALPTDRAQLAQMTAPAAPAGRRGAFLGIDGLDAPAPPPAPEGPDRFADYEPVTQAMLTDPAPEDWPAWRGGHNAQGWSALEQIDAGNVAQLTTAWSVALPAGPNMNEPLVRGGVVYVHAYGDEVFALDGATGAVIWRYQRHHAEGARHASKKTMALFGDKLFVATADVHMVALDARTGRPVWDRPLTDRSGMRIPGGPLAAEGVVMVGTASQAPGGAIIVGFDTETGDRLWTFNTVAQPGEPGGDTWNGLALENRSGGSSWTSGSYDAQTGLALWGVAPTYDTAPLRVLNEGENNDALYTDATVALDPQTGELVWFYQHMKNDQWDLDWVFERTVADIEIDGAPRHVVMTAGKPSIFDVLDAATGAYLGSYDMGLQNFITAIDPATGEKSYDPALIPGGGNGAMTVCPNGGGGRNWPPTAFNPETRTMFVGARESCMALTPTGDGSGLLTTGISLRGVATERAAEDGLFGTMQAIDMQALDMEWETRRRPVYSTGILATKSGLLFAGTGAGRLAAYDQQTGAELWSAGLINGPTGAPVTYAVDGKQYVAMVVGHGNPMVNFNLTPEFSAPPVPVAAITVFALPD